MHRFFLSSQIFLPLGREKKNPLDYFTMEKRNLYRPFIGEAPRTEFSSVSRLCLESMLGKRGIETP